MPIKRIDMAKKKSKIGCLFWIALILLVVVIFLFNRERIKNVLETTGFTTFISNRREERKKNENGNEPEIISETDENGDDSPETEGPSGSQEEPTIIEVTPEVPEEEPAAEEEEQSEAAEEPGEEPAPDYKYRNAKLYFIDVDDSGVITLQAVVRSVPFLDSPLTETMQALLEGMKPTELNMELINLIPDNTELLSIRVESGVAYINFNESFRFNSLGKEGYVAQLKQVVYTATEFSTVDSVQILIQGERFDYLGPEGVFIGRPLTRSSFN